MLKSIFSSFLVLTLLSNLTFAQGTSTRKTHDVVETLPEIVITATRVEEALKDITQGVKVITRSDIEKKGVEFITDILRSQADLGIVQNGGVGKNATLFLRGGSPNQTVFMIDGVKVKSPATGSLDISGIIVDDIERIEIIKGPQSTLYGSDAMGGVINIIMKRGSGMPKLSISAEGGSFSTFKTDASISGSKDISAGSILDYRFTATYFDTDGISSAKSGTENDGYTNKSFSTKIGITPSEKSGVELSMRYYEDFSKLDGFQFGVGLVDDLNFVQRGKHFLISTKGNYFLQDYYEQILTLSNISDNLKFEDPDTPSNNATIDTMMQTIDWQHNLYLKGITLTAGAEYRRESAEDKGNLHKNINNRAIYLNGKVKVFQDSLIFNAGMRYDDHEIAGSKITYRTGVLYNLIPSGLRFRANYATGFRAPSLNELYYPFFGNPNLKPEKSEGYDVGIEKDFYGKKLQASATYFTQEYTDLIEYDFSTFTAMNIGKADIKGFDLDIKIRPVDYIMLKTAYTNLYAIERDTYKQLTRRPKDKVNVSIEYELQKLKLLGEYLYVSERFDSAVNRNLSSYSLVNLKGRFVISKNFTFFARVDNLFNENYEEAGGYGTAGVSAFGGIRVEF